MEMAWAIGICSLSGFLIAISVVAYRGTDAPNWPDLVQVLLLSFGATIAFATFLAERRRRRNEHVARQYAAAESLYPCFVRVLDQIYRIEEKIETYQSIVVPSNPSSSGYRDALRSRSVIASELNAEGQALVDGSDAGVLSSCLRYYDRLAFEFGSRELANLTKAYDRIYRWYHLLLGFGKGNFGVFHFSGMHAHHMNSCKSSCQVAIAQIRAIRNSDDVQRLIASDQ